LNFESNPIPALPSGIGALKNLKVLNLSGCKELQSLPAEIGNLTGLEELDLSGCSKLRSLPDEILNLKNLKVLDITGTRISASAFKKAVPACEVIETKK
jgi:Leucine-rich repeat (LRR) protein